MTAFGAGRDRRTHHRLQHLRSGDHRAVAHDRFADDLLLQARELGIADFHAQVATGHHHHVGRIDDFAEHRDRIGTLDLRHDGGIATGFAQQAAGFVQIGRRANERHGKEIGAHLGGQLDVVTVLVGQRRHGETAALAVQALAVREAATDDDAGVDLGANHIEDGERHEAVIEQQHVARDHILGQVVVADAHAGLVAGRGIRAAIEHEAVARQQVDRAVSELLDTDLRALQVGQDANFAAHCIGGGAHGVGAGAVVIGGTVRQVQANDIHALLQDLLEHARRIGGRAEGGDDLGAANLDIGHLSLPCVCVLEWGRALGG
jgi:hypothetical protein